MTETTLDVPMMRELVREMQLTLQVLRDDGRCNEQVLARSDFEGAVLCQVVRAPVCLR